MDQETYDRKVQEIKSSGDADADVRIARLGEFFKAEQAAERRAEKDKLDAAENSLRRDLRMSYFSANRNATEADFQRDYPVMRTERMRTRAAAADAEAKRASRGMYRDL